VIQAQQPVHIAAAERRVSGRVIWLHTRCMVNRETDVDKRQVRSKYYFYSVIIVILLSDVLILFNGYNCSTSKIHVYVVIEH